MWREARIRDSDCETLTPEMRELKQGQWLRVAGVRAWFLKEDQENATNGKQKDSVREEIVAVSSTTKISIQDRHQNPLLPLNHRRKRMVEAYREERVSEAVVPSGKFARQPCREYIKIKCTRPPCDHWHRPECQLYENRIGMQIRCARLRTGRLKINPAEHRRRMVTKMQRLSWIIHDSWLRISGHRAAGNFMHFDGRAQSLGTNSTYTILKSYAMSHKHPKKQRSTARSDSSQKSSSAQSYAPKFEDRSQEENGQKCPKAQERGQSYFYSPTEVFCTIRNKTGGKSIRCRFQSINAHGEQERPELSRIGHL